MSSTPSSNGARTSTQRPRRRWTRTTIAGTAVLACGALTAVPALAIGNDGPSSPLEASADQNVQVDGTITAVDGSTFDIDRAGASPLTVLTTDATTIRRLVEGDLSDLGAGTFVRVGVGATDDGTLTVEWIEILDEPAQDDVDTSVAGDWAQWSLGVAGTVESVDLDNGVVTLTTDDGPLSLVTTDATEVQQTEPLTVADLSTGLAVSVSGSAPDGDTMTADRVSVVESVPDGTDPSETIDGTDNQDGTDAPTTTVPSTTVPSTERTTEQDGDGAGPSNSRYHGSVTAVDATGFTLMQRDGSVLTVVTDEATEFRNKLAEDAAPASLEDVPVGAWVKVKGSLQGETLLAETVTMGPLVAHTLDGARGGWNASPNGGGADRPADITETPSARRAATVDKQATDAAESVDTTAQGAVALRVRGGGRG